MGGPEYLVDTDGFAVVTATLTWSGDASLALARFDGSVQTNCNGFEGSVTSGVPTCSS